MNEALRRLLETIRKEAEASQDPETRSCLRFALEAYRHEVRAYLHELEVNGELRIH